MRYVFLVMFAVALGGVLVYRELTTGLPVVLSAPAKVQVQAEGTSLLPDGWTKAGTVTLSASGRDAAQAGLDVEVRPAGEPFNNAPTDSVDTQGAGKCPHGATCKATASASIAVHLSDGAYHWQLRLHNGHGVSPWVAYPGLMRIDTLAPAAPSISSSTDPHPGTVYHSSTMTFAWDATDSGSGIQGYSWRLDKDAHGTARTDIRTQGNAATVAGLDTGTYYFHVRAADRAGNWGPSATFPVRIDVTPPGLAHVRFNQFRFDPMFDPLRVSFAVTKAATSVRVGVYRQKDQQLVRLYSLANVPKGGAGAIGWDGKDTAGRVVPAGLYEIYIRATDKYGHASVAGWRDFVVDYRRILVSLSQQKMWAYDGSRLVLTSLVTTGNRELPTPTGIFHIMGKFHPFTFHSPWPKSSPFYYPPSKTEYAMLFQAGGYFIHDAPWRSAFGPGTNAQIGKPGSNFTGTHGCVNTPSDVAQRLFAWADVGTVVQVVQ